MSESGGRAGTTSGAPDATAEPETPADSTANTEGSSRVTSPSTSPSTSNSNGKHADDGPPPRPVLPPRKHISILPAMIVAIIALVLMLGAGISAVLTGQPKTVNLSNTPKVVPGTPLRAIPARHQLGPIELGGQPPVNIIDAVTLPSAAKRVAVQDNGEAAGAYDAQEAFVVPGNQLNVITFYKAEMKDNAWKSLDDGPARGVTNGIELLGQLAGDDTYYWELGVVISPTTFTASGSGATTGHTRFVLRLIQESDTT